MTLIFKPYIAVEVYQSNGTTMIAELPRRWDISGSEPLNVPGVGTITLSLDDPVITRHPTIFDMGNWVKFYIGDGLGHGDYCHAFKIKVKTTRSKGTAEAADRLLTVSGPTPLELLDDFMVKHETPPRPDASETRAYSWTAKEGEWYSAADWADTIVDHGRWDDHITTARSGTIAKPKYKPHKWPVKSSHWLSCTGGGNWQFFRSKVTIPTGGLMVGVWLSADEISRCFINGDIVISRDDTENGYKTFSFYKTFLPAGVQQIAVMMRSKSTPGGDGIDAFLFAMCSLNGKGEPDKILRKSVASKWEAHNGLPVPAWNEAEILRSQVLEAKTRLNDSALMLTLNFNKTTDTAGVAWGTREFSKNMAIYTSILDSQSQLSALGLFDVWVDPVNFNLNAYRKRGSDISDSVTLEPGRNLLDWEVTETDEIKNIGGVHYDGGWTEYTAAASVSTYGAREVGISLGSVADDDTATTIASQHIERKKHARKRAGAAPEIDRNPDDQPSASIVASPGTVPGIDYRTGGVIKVPPGTGVKTKQRLMGMTFTEDNNTAQVTFDPEFAEED